MTIETKYNIGDEVWCIQQRIKQFTIVGVRVTIKRAVGEIACFGIEEGNCGYGVVGLIKRTNLPSL